MLQLEHENVDVLNLSDDHPLIMFGPMVEEQRKEDEGEIPPFFLSLNIHDLILHNAMFDSGASHSLMPKAIMENLGLDITKPYKDLYSFDSRKVKCLGLIKDLVVSLAQIPVKSMVMDVIVADIPVKFGMLLSRSCIAKLKGTIQMNMSYATILVFNQSRKLYRETRMAYMVSSKDCPSNHPIYALDVNLGTSILCYDDDIETTQKENLREIQNPEN